MTIDLKAIRAAAEAATPGPWKQVNGVLYGKDFDPICAAAYGIGLGQADTRYGSNCKRKENGEFLKQIDPAAILELLDRLEAAEKDAARLDWILAYFVSDDTSKDAEIIAASDVGVDQLKTVIDAAMKDEQK